MSPRFDATFRAVTSATDDLRFDELVDRDPIPFWGRGVVTLLGDAAHPVLPHTGQGAAQAIVDAVALGEALTGDVDAERALRAYERERLAKTATLLAAGAPDGAHHADDESGGVLPSRSRGADDSGQAVREVLREDQSARGY